MGEEIRNPGTELNEAALESASGGDKYTVVISDAQQLCNNCPLRPARTCNQETLLKQYLYSLYPKRIRRYADCPITNSPRESGESNMGEVNERDLEQVAGGNGSDFKLSEWEKRNCAVCALHPCDSKQTAINMARRVAAEGRNYRCPGRSLYPAQGQ